MKKVYIFMLMLLLVSQTIIGPVATVYASEVNDNSSLSVGDHQTDVQKGGQFVDVSTDEDGGDSSKDEGNDAEDVENIAEEDSSFDGEVNDDECKPEATEEDEISSKCEEDNSGSEECEADNADGSETVSECEENPSDEEAHPKTLNANTFDPIMDPKVIRSVEFTVNGEVPTANSSIDVRNGDSAHFRFNVSYNAAIDGGNYGEGTTLTYELPEVFDGLELPTGTAFGSIGTLSVEGRNILITFNDELNGNAPIEGANGEPYAYFEVKASFSSSNTDWEKDIILPGGYKVSLNFQPKGGEKITKEGTPDNGGKNSKFIDWTVIVNTNLGASGTQDFVDELEGEHIFVTNSIIVREIPITPNGPGTPSELASVTPVFEGNKKMTITLPEKPYTAYEITYRTEVGDPGNVRSANFENKATYNGKPVSKNPQVTFGDPLAKTHTGPGNDLITTWTIRYNFNNRNIPQDKAKLEDNCEVVGGSGTTVQDMVPGSFKVYEEDGTTEVDDSQYTMMRKATGDGFDLSFNQPVTKAYIITYKTKPNGVYPTVNFTVENTVKRIDMVKPETSTATYGKKSLLLNKTAEGVDYEGKRMNWKVVANQAGYNLPAGTSFDDTYGDTNLELDETSLVVKVNNETTEAYTLSKKTDENDTETGFIIKLTNPTDKQIEITYTTGYLIKDSGKNNRDRTYSNTMSIIGSGLPVNPSDYAEQKIKNEQKENGKKSGHYDYAKQTFHWDVLLNFNYNTLNKAVFEDELPKTQKVTSIKVTEGTLDKDGKFVPGQVKTIQNTSSEAHKIKLELDSISVPYKVEYTSEDADGVFPHSSGNIKITNKATLTNDTVENASWTKTIEVKYTDKIFNKSGQQSATGSALINWNFAFNYAQSELNNVVITDTVGKRDGEPDQLILEESFKIYQVGFTGITPNNPTEIQEPLDPSVYSLDVDVKNGVFTLDLGDVKGAYYVTYDTVYTGSSGSSVQNDVAVTYNSSNGSLGSDQAFIANFRYGNNAATMKVPFVIVKTDAATGESMKDVEFALYGPYTGDRVLFSGKTDENGVLDFGVKLTEGKYTLKETKVDGYTNPNVTFSLHRDKAMKDGIYDGKQIVEVENVKEEGLTCSEFTLTINDIDRNPVSNQEVTLTNKSTGLSHKVITNESGQVKIPATGDKKIIAGTYTVSTNDEGELGDVIVQYEDECKGHIQPLPKCDDFTIIIEDKNYQPRPNVSVVLKHKTEDDVIDMRVTTDENGKFTVPSDTTKTGDYKVYEGKQYLGTVKITYKSDPCKAVITEAPTCETFALTIKDVDGKPREADIEITIKDKEGNQIAKGKTNVDGKVGITTPLPAGKYDVFEGDSATLFDEFEVNINCEAEVQPKPECTDFTIIVKGGNNELLPFTNVTVKKDKNGNSIHAAITDKDGMITIPSEKLPAGQYFILTGDLFINEMTVSYMDNCKTTVSGAPVCEDFTLTIHDVYENVRPNVEIVVKDSTGKTIITQITNINGQIKYNEPLYKGKYTVYEGTSYINSFTVENTCTAVVKPIPYNPEPTNPTPIEPKPNEPNPVCTDFTISVNQNGKHVGAGKEILLKDGEKEVAQGSTNSIGKVQFLKTDLPNGVYDVYVNRVNAGKVTVDSTCAAVIVLSTPTEPETPEPGKPEKPGKPGEENPSNPNKPNKPDTPTKPGDKGSVEGDGGNKVPSVPNKPGKGNKPSSGTVQSGGGSKGPNANASGKETLPQTGEEKYMYMLIIGFSLLIIGGFMVRRRKINE